ncbi:MAG: aspartate/glutamate racemase family protein [Spirochaetales bacterium]
MSSSNISQESNYSILVINPNTSNRMTEEIRQTVEKVFATPWQPVVVSAPAGPESLESWRDYSLAATAILPLLAQYPSPRGILLSCFGDPGLFALKEMASCPVVGIAEASFSLSLLLGGKFGILAGMDRAVTLMDSLVQTYGLKERYAGTEPLNLRVLSFDEDKPSTLRILEQAATRLIKRGAEVLILGCAGLTGFQSELMQKVSTVVIDPVEAGCRMLKSLLEGGYLLAHSGLYSRPASQRMLHLERVFSPTMAKYLSSWEKAKP